MTGNQTFNAEHTAFILHTHYYGSHASLAKRILKTGRFYVTPSGVDWLISNVEVKTYRKDQVLI